MEKTLVLAGTLMAAITATSAAYAAGPGGHGMRGHAPVSFEQIDTDGNGEVSRAEFQAFGEARFAAVDTDGDGFLSGDELAARGQERAASRIERMMQRADANQDGKLSLEEMRNAVPRRQALFETLDVDKSGGLTRDELAAGRKGPRHKHSGKWNKG
ncbi:MAG: EF-hand domain-containing protein [Marinibacterium sp.]